MNLLVVIIHLKCGESELHKFGSSLYARGYVDGIYISGRIANEEYKRLLSEIEQFAS